MNMSHATMSCTVPYRSNTLAFEDIFIKLLKKNLKRPTKKVHCYWLPPAALGSLEMEFPWLRLPTAFWVFKRWKNASYPLGTMQWWELKRLSHFYLNQDDASNICWRISMRCLLQDSWVMLVNKDVQTDAPHSCAKPMHQIHAKNGICPKFKGQNSRRTVSPNLVFFQSDSIRLVVSAAIDAPSACSGDLNFWEWFQSRSEHLRLPCEMTRCELIIETITFQHSRLTVESV